MSLTVYPEAGYTIFLSVVDATDYFQDRLDAGEWDTADQAAALMTAYRSLQELDIVIDLSDSDALQAIKDRQCEQALFEIQYNRDERQASGISLAGLLSVQFPAERTPTARYSPRALAILRLYIRGRTVTRTH